MTATGDTNMVHPGVDLSKRSAVNLPFLLFVWIVAMVCILGIALVSYRIGRLDERKIWEQLIKDGDISLTIQT